MNREIKFRAWDYEAKKMMDWVTLAPRIYEIYGHDKNDNATSLEFMQFTGLLDKNGKEIYEGDIVKTHFDKTDQYEAYDEIGEVCFEALRWTIEDRRHGKNNRFYEHSEVIGNIYENSELLETN